MCNDIVLGQVREYGQKVMDHFECVGEYTKTAIPEVYMSMPVMYH